MVEEYFKLGTPKDGAMNAVEKVLGLKAGEGIVIVGDSYTRDVVDALGNAANDITGPRRVVKVYLEEFGDRAENAPLNPDTVMTSSKFMGLIGDIEKSPASIYAGRSLKGETRIRGAMRRAGTERGGRVLSLPNVSEKIMCQGFCTDLEAVDAFTGAMYRTAYQASKAKVTSRVNKTDADISFHQNYRWDKLGSRFKSGEWGNVPAEVYTCPGNVSGKWVNDVGMGDVFTRYGLLTETPLTLTYENGRVVKALCENKELLHELAACWKRYNNGDVAGEFGAPANPEISAIGPSGVNMQDEKAYIHVANGNPRPERTGAIWDCPGFHVDHTTRGANLDFTLNDGSTIRVLDGDLPTDSIYSQIPDSSLAERLRYRVGAIQNYVAGELSKGADRRNYMISLGM